MSAESFRSVTIFYCYAHRDKILLDELNNHLGALRRSGLINGWYDGEILPGASWEAEIVKQLNIADILLLLISPDFISSDYCYSKEMTWAIERHYAKKAIVVPILLRPVDWEGTPFSTLQMLPTGAKPITSWTNQDEAFENIARGIRRVVQKILVEKYPSTVSQMAQGEQSDKSIENEEPRKKKQQKEKRSVFNSEEEDITAMAEAFRLAIRQRYKEDDSIE